MWRRAEELSIGGVPPFDQSSKLQLTDFSSLDGWRHARSDQPIHFLLDGLAFLFPVLNRVLRHATPPRDCLPADTGHQKWNKSGAEEQFLEHLA